jgi:hypothetical protein
VTLRVTGWPTVAGDGITSRLGALTGDAAADVLHREQASPMGPGASLPRLTFPVHVGEPVAALVTLARADVPSQPATVTLVDGMAAVRWPDGVLTRTPLPTA